MASVESYWFQSLGVSASLWLKDVEWFPIYVEPNITFFELEHDVDGRRGAYNLESFDWVLRHRRTLRGEHAGFSDFFVPIMRGEQIVAILVAGPFGRARLSAEVVLERWQRLSGREGHTGDPDFRAYLFASLSTVVFDPRQVTAFGRLLSGLAHLMAGEGRADKIASEIERQRVVLDPARRVERMSEAVRMMVDDRFPRSWQTRSREPELEYYGLAHAPDRVLVALAGNAEAGSEPVQAVIRRDAFQRAVVDYAAGLTNVLAGRVGDYGVVFLVATTGASRRRQQQLSDLADRIHRWARTRFAVALHFGTDGETAPESLSRRYQAALGAAQSALIEGSRMVVAGRQSVTPAVSLWEMRRSLGRILEEQPDRLAARFDEYLEVVGMQCGYRIDAARSHLEVGFERLIDVLARQGLLDERSFQAMREELERATSAARTTNELFDHYRRAVAEMSAAARSPVSARHDKSLRRALDHIRQHFTEPLRLDHVARVAGFTPSYFSKLFIRSEGTPFTHYITRLRVDRAKHLLTTTELDLSRVARLSGFGNAPYLCAVFRQAAGVTPAAWRARSQPVGPETKNHNHKLPKQ